MIPRDQKNNKPFLLLDGHGSRLQMAFLKYINTPEDHWVVCLGVPYGTALWQVGDSKEQNGSFNMALTKAKQQLLQFREKKCLPESLYPQISFPSLTKLGIRALAELKQIKKLLPTEVGILLIDFY